MAADIDEDSTPDTPTAGPETTPEAEATLGADEPRTRKKSRWAWLGSLPALVVIALLVAIVVKTFLIQAFYIPSESMEPTLMVGDRVFVNKLVYDLGDIHRGDVIVFENPNDGVASDRGAIGGFLHWLGEGVGFAQPEGEDYIKRVVGLPGETIEIADQTVLVDGQPLDEPYLTAEKRSCNADFGPVTVPSGKLFMLGDNRCNSADSRYGLGFVPESKVIGKAFVVIWPPSDLGGV
jgi:signal peptidase I